MQNEINSSGEWQKSITDHIPAMIAFWDQNERCEFANKPYFEWFGFTPESLYGRTLKELLGDFIYEQNKPYIAGALAGTVQHFERDLRRKIDGQLRHTQASYMPHVVNGQVLGFFVLVSDITERKKAELAARQAQQEALEAYQIKSKFLANMSHEIRTPMNGILGMLNIALRTSLSVDQRKFLEAANHSAEHLLSIINDILDISKIEAGQMTLTREHVRLRELVESTLAAAVIQAEQKGLKTQVFVTDDVPDLIFGDSVRLRQVLLNLFGNAVKFTPRGRIELKVFMKDEDRFQIDVSDTGIGIPNDKLETIFLPFRQVDDSRSRVFGGTGLGLSICKELVRMMGGELQVESRVGQGSRFFFSLPAEQVYQGRTPLFNLKQAGQNSGLSVLNIEEDAVCALIQERMLESLGCEVTTVTEPSVAIERAKKASFQMILIGLSRLSADGSLMIREFRRIFEERSLQVPIVALGVQINNEKQSLPQNSGADFYLTEPIELEKLAELVLGNRSHPSR